MQKHNASPTKQMAYAEPVVEENPRDFTKLSDENAEEMDKYGVSLNFS